MRVLGRNVINELVVADSISGREETIYYRTPTLEERIEWMASLYLRDGSEVISNIEQANHKWGKEIIVGFNEADFGVAEGENSVRPFSSDPDSKHYRADWKEILCELGPDIPQFVARIAFDGHRQIRNVQPKRYRYDSKN